MNDIGLATQNCFAILVLTDLHNKRIKGSVSLRPNSAFSDFRYPPNVKWNQGQRL